jgi:hypothetical protein
VIVRRDRGHRRDDHGRVLLGSLELVQRLELVPEGGRLDAVVEVPSEEVVGDGVGSAQLRLVDGVELGPPLVQTAVARVDGLGPAVHPSRVPARPPVERRRLGHVVHVLLPAPLDQLKQPLARAHGRHARRIRHLTARGLSLSV